MDNFFKLKWQAFKYSEPWIYIDGWKSNTVEHLEVLDLGIDKLPQSRNKAIPLFNRDGFVVERHKGIEPYEREFVFLARTRKALHKLYGKIQTGQVYELILSDDPGFVREGFLQSVESEKLNVASTKVTCSMLMQPYKRSRQTSTFFLPRDSQIVNVGDAVAIPKIIISGRNNVAMTIGTQTLRLNMKGKRELIVDCKEYEVYTTDGELANDCILAGFFPHIPVGRVPVSIEGGTAQIETHWRYNP